MDMLRVGGAASGSTPEPLVRFRGVSKHFGATRALDSVDLDVFAGSVLALLGQNGAGKSTLIKILAGVYTRDRGAITVAGHPLGSPQAMGRVSFIHQDLGLVPGLQVAENVALGAGYPRHAGLIGWRDVRRRAERALDIIGSNIDPRARVADLSRTEKSLVAIGRALAVDAQVLVLDEPTASLPVDETERLFGVLRRLRDDGLAIIYVSHRLDEVFQIADRVTVVRDGRVVLDAPLAGLTPGDVVTHIVGHQPVPPPPALQAAAQRMVVDVSELVGHRFGPVSLTVHAGEVVGLVGLSGAGHVELGRTLIGAQPRYAGTIDLFGRPYRPTTVAGAVARGIGFVTSNRQDEGLAMSLTVTENLLPNPAVRGARPWQFRRNRLERRQAQLLVEEFGVRPASSSLNVAALSGGNQQKVILGRWLSTDAKLLILEEPTAGVDVGAKREIYTLLDRALLRGVAVLLISTDFEEVAQVSHRAIVFKDGLIVRHIPLGSLTVKSLVAFASGAAA
jgi:ribose transport system ATP-binding protein